MGRAHDDPRERPRRAWRPGHEARVQYYWSGYYRDTYVPEDSPWIWPDCIGEEAPQDARGYDVEWEEWTSELLAKAQQ